MPLDIRSRLDLINSDPNLAFNLRGGPDPQDEFLYLRLGQDYQNYRQMRRDPHVRSSLRKLRQSILGRRMIVEAGGAKRVDRIAAQTAESYLQRIRYEGICSKLLNSGQLIGFSVLRLDWPVGDDAILPSAQFVPQDRFCFAFHQPDDRTIPICTDEALDPAREIVLLQGYELRLLTRRSPLTGERCPKNRFLVYTFDGDESPWGLGLGYSIYPWWTVKREAMKAWLMHSDRSGSPPTVGTHPPIPLPIPGQPENPELKAAISQFEAFLRSVSPAAWARLPVGFEAKVLEVVGSTGGEVHQGLIQMADNQISKVVLGEIPYSDKGTGSYAANLSQVEDRESALIDGECNLLDEQLQQQLWEPIARLNFPNAVCPIVRRESRADIREQDAKKQQQEELLATAARDKVLMIDLGLVPTPEYIQETYGEQWSLPVAAQQPSAEFHEFRATIDRVVRWNGLAIGLEYPPGSVRFRGTKFERKLKCGYGHIRGYMGADKEALDIYLHPDLCKPDADAAGDRATLFQISQLSADDGDFDEHKLMAGFDDIDAAKDAYIREMSEAHFGGIKAVSVADLEQYRRKTKDSASNHAEADDELLSAAEWDAIANAVTDGDVIAEAMQQLAGQGDD